jgi:DNA-directed RNA polymerase subunit H (RpoH/RPB5)
MFSVATGYVLDILKDNPELQELRIQIDGHDKPERAYNYPKLNHSVRKGEKITVNTAAVKLGLGTGGRHFVIPEYAASEEFDFPGHIMKLRYTPWQFPILAAEEENSPFHEVLKDCDTLEGTPVVMAPLHSMLPGVILGFRKIHPNSKIAYIMTDGAALPMALSDLVRELKKKQLLDLTITSGHAFGGDLEAVSIPSAVLAAKQAINPDLIIIALGPGIVGTGTAFGFSGVEQSWYIDIVSKLHGKAVVVPRLSDADSRERHLGISHHSLTILHLSSHPALLGLSKRLPKPFFDQIIDKLHNHHLLKEHHWYLVDDPSAEELFKEYQIQVKTMGRNIQEDPWFFQSSVTTGFLAGLAAKDDLSSLEPIIE